MGMRRKQIRETQLPSPGSRCLRLLSHRRRVKPAPPDANAVKATEVAVFVEDKSPQKAQLMTAVSTRHTTSETSATTREVASIELSDQTASASGEDLLGDDADDGAAVAEFDTDAVAARSTTLETSLPYCRATG